MASCVLISKAAGWCTLHHYNLSEEARLNNPPPTPPGGPHGPLLPQLERASAAHFINNLGARQFNSLGVL